MNYETWCDSNNAKFAFHKKDCNWEEKSKLPVRFMCYHTILFIKENKEVVWSYEVRSYDPITGKISVWRYLNANMFGDTFPT